MRNTDRSLGAMLAGEIARRDPRGLPDGTIHLVLRARAGRASARGRPRGLTLDLVGQCNDYVGKGLSPAAA